MKFHIPANPVTHPLNRHWQFSVGSGHALLALRTDYTRQLKFIHDTLGIERVRFHGIFNDDMHTLTNFTDLMPIPGGERFQEINFHNAGIAYDNVLAAGMKPFVELGFMPEKLASGTEQLKFFYKGNITPPADYAAWEHYIQSFIRYLQHRYGEEEVRTWVFEVWNEPDLQGMFFGGTRDEYFELYAHTARAIKAVDPQIKVGGPATSGSKWVQSFVEYCRANDVPVDFVSTHQYAGDPLGGVTDQGGPEENPDAENAFSGGFESFLAQIAQGMANAKGDRPLDAQRAIMVDKSEIDDIPNDGFARNAKIVKEQAQGLPLYYTEWNENATFSAYTNDTRKAASYLIKAALETEQTVTGSSGWCFSDLFEEFHLFQEQFHGGFGLITVDGIPKPTYYALRFLHDVGDARIDLGEDATKGEIGAAAFKGKDGTQLLLFRQKMKNLDLPKESAEVTIELPKAPKSVTVQKIDEENGNPLKIWEEMGKPYEMNKAEIEAVASKSTVPEVDLPCVYENGVLTVKAELGVNDVWLVKIEENV